jgi:hypothetical protein
MATPSRSSTWKPGPWLAVLQRAADNAKPATMAAFVEAAAALATRLARRVAYSFERDQSALAFDYMPLFERAASEIRRHMS